MDAVIYERLTARERGVLLAAASGKSAKQIGQALGISHRTVEDAQYTARTKLGVGRTIVAAQMLVAYEASLNEPVEIPVGVPVAESVADRALFPATALTDELPLPQPSVALNSSLKEASLAFETVPIKELGRPSKRRFVDALPRGLLIALATAVGVPLVLAILTILYLGLSTIERVSLAPR